MSIPTTDLANLPLEQKRALLERLLREKEQRNTSRPRPLSSAQQRLWFLDKLHPNSAVYNVPTVLHLTAGPVQVEWLRQSLEKIVERHHALRTTFISTEDSPSQQVNPAPTLELPVVDLRGETDPDRTKHLHQVIADEVRRPFDLTTDLMVRALVIHLSDEETVLVLVTHHIASDEWSLRILLKEWAELYTSLKEGRNASVPNLPIQYADFAAWQQEWLQGDACSQQLRYWTQHLKGASTLQLPTTFSRPADQTFEGEILSATLSKELAAELRALSQANDATLFMTLLAAFKVLLHRYSQQEDIVVGCPIAGRTREETEPLIGFFVNTLAIRSQVEDTLSFRHLLAQVRENTLAAYANQDVPFERIVEEIHPERSSNRMPLVQVVFALNNDYVQEQLFPGVRVRESETSTGTSKFDITFVTRDTPSGLVATVEYNSNLYNEAAIKRLLAHFEQILRSIVAQPEGKIASLQITTKAERDYLVHALNNTVQSYPREETVDQVFEKQAVKTPGAVAAQFGNEIITYRDLDEQANQVAHFLTRQGVGNDTLVGVYLERSIRMIVAFLGILKAGAAYVPLDLSYPKERLAFMMQDTEMPLILTEKSRVQDLPATQARAVSLDEARDVITTEPRLLPPKRAHADSLAYVIYTSGSTGQPKGVCVPHRGITRLVCNTDYVHITPEDSIAQASNASFDAATFEIWGALLNGARIVGISKDTALSPEEFRDALRDQKISILFLTTALFNQLAREVPGVFAPLKSVMFGGEAVDPKWVRAVMASHPPRQLLHVYGPTENTTFSTWFLIEEVGDDDYTVPIGKPIANSELYILDSQLEPVPIGVNGEVYVGGDGLSHGYWKRPELTEARFVPHPFSPAPGARLYKTGDLARFDDNGNVLFVGRIDHQIKLRGFRIELGEIEALLARHPGVSNNLVMLREDVPGDKRIVAYIIPKGTPPSVGDLRSHLREQLPDYMTPAAFVFLQSFPLTPNEKIDRKALPVPELNRPDLNRTFLAPRNETEEKLVKIWEKVLGIQPIGVADNFFELGGHSLLAVKLFSQIEKQLEKKLPLATLFRAPTVEQIAHILREENPGSSWSTIVDIQATGTRPPFFWIHTLGGDGGGGFFYYRKLAELLGPDQPSFGIRSPQEPFTRIDEMSRFYIKELRKFQPSGPYFLGGFCFGGNVAYEMAQQLVASGEEVGLLIMLESAPPNVNSKQSWSATAAKYSLENIVENVKDFVHNSPREQLAFIKNKGKRLRQKLRSRIAPPADEERQSVQLKDMIDLKNYPEGYVKFAETHWQALTQYQPGLYPGEMYLFRAKKQGLSNFNHTLGWDTLVEDRVHVSVIPGTHESMLQEPNVQIVAAQIRGLLDQAQHRNPKSKFQRELVAAA